MNREVTVCLQATPMTPSKRLATLDFKADQSANLVIEADVQLSESRVLSLSGAVSTNNNFSLAGIIGKQHLFLFSGRWENTPPYLGVYVSEMGFLHFYFEIRQ